jgi:hypothetical protein
MTDIGKGDVVAATRRIVVSAVLTANKGGYLIEPGTRAIVAGFTDGRESMCPECGDRHAAGLLLEQYPLIHRVAWCQCEWRKIGGSRSDHVGWFEGYLKTTPIIPPGALERLFDQPRRLR